MSGVPRCAAEPTPNRHRRASFFGLTNRFGDWERTPEVVLAGAVSAPCFYPCPISLVSAPRICILGARFVDYQRQTLWRYLPAARRANLFNDPFSAFLF